MKQYVKAPFCSDPVAQWHKTENLTRNKNKSCNEQKYVENELISVGNSNIFLFLLNRLSVTFFGTETLFLYIEQERVTVVHYLRDVDEVGICQIWFGPRPHVRNDVANHRW